MIVKVQVAQFPPGAPALVYDEKRHIVSQQKLSAAIVKQLRGEPKGYFEATMRADGTFEIGKRVATQNW